MELVKFVSILLLLTSNVNCLYSIPNLQIQALHPKGLRVILPGDEGIGFFAFHANINKRIRGKEEGEISRNIKEPVNGIWVIEDNDLELKVGNVLHYWIFVQHDRLGFDKENQRFEVTALVDRTEINCKNSPTVINGGKSVCGDTIIFEDDFSSRHIDTQKWKVEKYIPSGPDYEFNSYEPQSCNQRRNILYIEPTWRNDNSMEPLDLSSGCTHPNPENCKEKFPNHPPPVISGKITSRLSFKYGTIEIRAQLPRGDWIYPKIELLPKNNVYGDSIGSGKFLLAYARGNENENNNLHIGPVLGNSHKFDKTKSFHGQKWSYAYHTFTVTWTPEEFRVVIDNNSQTTVEIRNVPFDEEFVLSIGVGVGGFSDFSDLASSTPWKHRSVKARQQFNANKNFWIDSWQADNTPLKVDYVRVKSL